VKTVKQIDLSVENIPGALSRVSDLLSEYRINVIACYATAQEKEFNFHFIANDPDKAINVLGTAGYRFDVQEVIACEIPHHPGGLNAILKPLKKANLNVDFMYPCIATGSLAVLIVGLQPVQDALKIFEDNWIRILGSDLYHI